MIAICMETLFPIKSMGNSSRQRIMKGAKWEKVKKGNNWESGFHKERMVYTQDELQIHEQENEYRSISTNFKSVGNG